MASRMSGQNFKIVPGAGQLRRYRKTKSKIEDIDRATEETIPVGIG